MQNQLSHSHVSSLSLPGAAVQCTQAPWAPLPGRGPHPLPPGRARARTDTAGHDAHVPPHLASEGGGISMGCQTDQHFRGATAGEKRGEVGGGREGGGEGGGRGGRGGGRKGRRKEGEGGREEGRR